MKTSPLQVPLVFMTSLGCSKNWVDAEIIMAGLLQVGFGCAVDEKEADVWVINTCGFIASARAEGDDFMTKAVKWKKRAPKRRKIVICGCIVSSDFFSAFREKFPEVDLWLAPDDVPNVPQKFLALYNENKVSAPTLQAGPKFLYDHMTPRVQLTPEHFAYVKIADGCDNCCSYCAIPRIRGKNRSRTIASVVEEIRNLAKMGVKEMLLIGQDITRFGEDRPGGETLMQLLHEIEKIPGDFWVRLLYLHPARYPDELTALYQNATHLVPYLEMPIQHISDKLLKSMNRKVTAQKITDIFTNLRKNAPQVVLRTTFIVGYPGETDADFQAVLDLMQLVRFDHVGAFIFQPEPHTVAATLPNPVPLDLAQKRYDALMQLQSSISEDRNRALIGQEMQLLIDDFDGEKMIGRTYRDAPDIDPVTYLVKFPKTLKIGDWASVKITDAGPYHLEATAIASAKGAKK